ncbi:MAG TPA: Uma2 family endonuclease [Gemmataceae bacterium]|nr:Uma2 family endonuclease [Gemmataceae bacterium]
MSTASVKTELMTAEEFYEWANLPENDNKWLELVRGEVIELPLPQRPHGVICNNVAFPLTAYTRKKKRYYITINDSGVLLERDPDTVRGPDVALYDDANRFVDLHPKYGEFPPLLAAEVLSPNDRADRIMEKIMDYLRNGVRLVWVIDPERRTVTVYTPDDGPRVFDETQTLTGNSVLSGLKCKVADFFQLPGDTTTPARKRKR